jgi:hypothetical protein
MDGVIRKSGKVATAHHASSVDHRRVQKSSTLNRKFVKRPVAKPKVSNSVAATSRGIQRQGYNRAILQKNGSVRLQPIQRSAAQPKVSAQVAGAGVRQNMAIKTERPPAQRVGAQKQVQTADQKQQAQRRAAIRQIAQKRNGDTYVKNAQAAAAKQRIAAKRVAAAQQEQAKPLTAQQMKDRAIQQALARMNKIEQEQSVSGRQPMNIQLNEAKESKGFFRGRKIAMAAGMAVVTIAVLGYLVYLNMPSLSARVAAMQAGIEKSYPSYVPANYRLDGLVKEDNGRITMNFKNDQGNKFTIMEEKSSWDSAAVLTNYVKKNWGDDYSIAKGQGLTIYVSDSNAAWVNGGVLYVITDTDGRLNSSDLHDIAVSL